MGLMTLAGPGVLYGTRTDAAGTTPCNFGLIKSMDLDFSFTTKPATGQFQVPFDFARGTLKGTFKAKMAAVSPLAMMSLFFGVSSATGGTVLSFLESGTIVATTVTVAHAATFVAPQEVIYALTGLPLQQVPSAPTVGQYSVAAGVFTFAAGDTGKVVLTSYTYTVNTGFNLTMTNQLQGTTPLLGAIFYQVKNGLARTRQLPLLCSEKLAEAAKEDDFTTPEIDGLIGANAAGQWLMDSYPQLS
jgi:hypothetical protein